MTQYKLIQEYPESPELGTIHWIKSDEFGTTSSRYWQGTIFYDANPKFWQKVEELDYEIISLKLTGGEILTFKNGKCIHRTDSESTESTFHLDRCMSTLSSRESIHSVKRLSDGEVFTIGDKICQVKPLKSKSSWKIKEFSLKDIRCFIAGVNITCIEKQKTPLFTTEDGVDIFAGDSYWFYNGDIMVEFSSAYIKTGGILSGSFSAKEKAEEYILLNKPLLSLNDLLSVWSDGVLDNVEYFKTSPLFKSFEKLAKSKL